MVGKPLSLSGSPLAGLPSLSAPATSTHISQVSKSEWESHGPALFLAACMTLMPALGATQVYRCEGTWTNNPCAGTPEATLPVISRSAREITSASLTPSPSSEPLAPRLSLVRKLKKLNREYIDRGSPGLNATEIESFESLCLERSRPLVDCQTSFTEHSKRLLDLELAKEANELAAQRNDIEQQKVDGYRRR